MSQQLVTIQLAVQAINSIEKYHRVERYLTGLNAVESAKILQVDGQSALFEASLRSNEDDLLNSIENDAELVKVDPPAENKPSPGLPHSSTELEIDIDQPVEQAASESEQTDVESDDELLAKQQNPVPVYYYKLIH